MDNLQVSINQEYRNSICKSQENINHPCLAFLYHSNMEIKTWVLTARKRAGLTQDQLGEAMGVTKGNISAWENGRHEPSWNQMIKINQLSGYPLPIDQNPFTSSEAGSTPSEDDFALIPQLDVRAACGPGGKFHDHVVVKGGLAFKKSFIREMGLTENTARVINADGPSMEPTIGHGRVVMVNLADTEPQDSKVFLICDEDGGMVLKRLVREYEPSIGATVWKIRSDNPDKRKYPDKVWPEDSRACIVGRAVWFDGLL